MPLFAFNTFETDYRRSMQIPHCVPVFLTDTQTVDAHTFDAEERI